MKQHTYETAERYILSREFFGMKLGLDNIRSFLDEIGTPQHDYLTIHISGTNGKGSTAAMLASVLQAAGYKTGLFTSPHLVSFRERARVNNRLIPKQTITSFINKYRSKLTRRKLSFFELTTALSLYYFSRANVDIAVIETGLGGRLDATNVLNPILTVTTEISRDHIEILGNSIPKIAKEKAGIIKQNTPHLIGVLPDSSANVFKYTCHKRNAPLIRLQPSDYTIDTDNQKITFSHNGFSLNNITPALSGIHQLQNTALVVRALVLLKEQGLKISKKAIREGIASTRWPARFQVIPMRGKPLHVFDVSHNFTGVTSFVESFKKKFPGQKAYIITGFVKRKEHQKMFNALAQIARMYALVPLSTKRTTDINELIQTLDFKKVPYKKFGKLDTAYGNMLKTCTPDDILIILGSHYLVGEFFKAYNISWR